MNTTPLSWNVKVGMWLARGTAVAGLVVVSVFMMSDSLRTTFGVDITKWIIFAWAGLEAVHALAEALNILPANPSMPPTPFPPVVPTVPVPNPSISSVPTPAPISDPTVEIPVGTPGAGTPTAPGPADALDGTSLLTTPHL